MAALIPRFQVVVVQLVAAEQKNMFHTLIDKLLEGLFFGLGFSIVYTLVSYAAVHTLG